MSHHHYFRIRFKKLGGHYHCRVFAAAIYTGTYAKLGDLTLDETDWLHKDKLFAPNAEWLLEESQ